MHSLDRFRLLQSTFALDAFATCSACIALAHGIGASRFRFRSNVVWWNVWIWFRFRLRWSRRFRSTTYADAIDTSAILVAFAIAVAATGVGCLSNCFSMDVLDLLRHLRREKKKANRNKNADKKRFAGFHYPNTLSLVQSMSRGLGVFMSDMPMMTVKLWAHKASITLGAISAHES